MIYRNVLDHDGRDRARGKQAEDIFHDLFVKKFGEERIVRMPDGGYENIHHADFIIIGKGGRKRRVDVKSAKFVDGKPSCWLEAVAWGKPGWIYGSQDFVAFEKPYHDGFVVIGTPKVLEYANRHIRSEITTRKTDAWYRLYLREKMNRSCDLLGLVPFEDIVALTDWELN